MTIKCLYKFIYAVMKCNSTKPFLDLYQKFKQVQWIKSPKTFGDHCNFQQLQYYNISHLWLVFIILYANRKEHHQAKVEMRS